MSATRRSGDVGDGTSGARRAGRWMGAFLALIWILQVFNWADGYRLDTAVRHPAAPRGRACRKSSPRRSCTSPGSTSRATRCRCSSSACWPPTGASGGSSLVTLIVAVTSGLAVWLFQSGNELTVGASGLIFGYFGYVLVAGSSTGTWSTSASGSWRACSTGRSCRSPSPARRGSAGSATSAAWSAACWRPGCCGRGRRRRVAERLDDGPGGRVFARPQVPRSSPARRRAPRHAGAPALHRELRRHGPARARGQLARD